jgi:hypothetical protein
MLNLGIIWKDGKVINHRSLLKVCINPILRVFGIEIASLFDENTFKRYVLKKCPRRKLIWSWNYKITDEIIERSRMWI